MSPAKCYFKRNAENAAVSKCDPALLMTWLRLGLGLWLDNNYPGPHSSENTYLSYVAKPTVWGKSGAIFLMICLYRENWEDSADWGINSGNRRKGSEASSHCSWHSWIRRCHQQPGLVCFCYVFFVVVGELEQLETCAAWSPILPTCPRCAFFFSQVFSQAPYFLPLLPLHSPCLLLYFVCVRL